MKLALRNIVPKRYVPAAKSAYLLLRGRREPEVDLLPYLVGRSGTSVDVGAHFGVYSHALAKIARRVVCVEPNDHCCATLKAWSRTVSNVEVRNIALGAFSGDAVLNIPMDDDGLSHPASATLLPTGEEKHGGLVRQKSVAVVPLDKLGVKEVSFIKIDVEGYELDVVKGAQALIEDCRPTLLVEIEQRFHSEPIRDVFSRILELGYRGYFLREGSIEPIVRFSTDRDQGDHGVYVNNFIFLPES
jgi:FkbM family methyltransferase